MPPICPIGGVIGGMAPRYGAGQGGVAGRYNGRLTRRPP